MTVLRVLLAVWLASTLNSAQAQEPAAAAVDPGGVVDAFHAALLAGLDAPADFDQRADALRPVLNATFDFSTIARICLGRTWRTLSADAQAEFVALLTDVILATYVSRFDADRGQRFEAGVAEQARPGQWLVRSRILRRDGEPVPLDYYLRGGRVFNVVADGVSDLAVRRADYNTVIKQSGLEALLASMREQVADYRDAFQAAS